MLVDLKDEGIDDGSSRSTSRSSHSLLLPSFSCQIKLIIMPRIAPRTFAQLKQSITSSTNSSNLIKPTSITCATTSTIPSIFKPATSTTPPSSSSLPIPTYHPFRTLSTINPCPFSSTSRTSTSTSILSLLSSSTTSSFNSNLGSLRFRSYGAEYQPSQRIRKRRHGFLNRLKSRGGRKILKRRLEKGRRFLTH